MVIRSSKLISFLAALAVLVITSATQTLAADMPLKAPLKTPPVLTGTWTGFYLGAVAGGALQNTIIDDKDCNLSCSSQNLNGSGFTAGVTGGWNYQFGPGLVGIEGDFNWANFKGSFTDPQWTSIHSAEWKSFSTIRGRAGLVIDRALIYATGGVAFVDINDYAHSTAGCDNGGCFSVTGVKTGLAAGVCGIRFGRSVECEGRISVCRLAG